MSTEPRPPAAAGAATPGKRRATRSPRETPRRRAPKRRRGALIAVMAAALLLCGGFTVVRPMVTDDDVTSVASRSAGTAHTAARSATARLDAATKHATSSSDATQPSATTTSLPHGAELLTATLTRLDNFGAPPSTVPLDVARLREDALKAQQAAARFTRLRYGTFDVKVAYYNMLGCYHTDHDEPNYGHLARNFASCSSRMPRQFDYLAEHGISIAGVGEFQGKAWGVLASYSRHKSAWGIYPEYQSGPYGQNPVVWRTSEWKLISGQQLRIPYNCANGGRCAGSSTLVLLQHVKRKRKIFVLSTHHTSDGGGGGAARRNGAFNVELDRIAHARASGVPIVYMGDFNSVGGPISRLSGDMVPAFTRGVGIDQIWGTPGLKFADTGYDTNFRRMGLTDHGSGIAITTLTMPAVKKHAAIEANARKR